MSDKPSNESQPTENNDVEPSSIEKSQLDPQQTTTAESEAKTVNEPVDDQTPEARRKAKANPKPKSQPAPKPKSSKPEPVEEVQAEAVVAKPVKIKTGRGIAFVAILFAFISIGGSGFLGWQFYLAQQELVDIKSQQQGITAQQGQLEQSIRQQNAAEQKLIKEEFQALLKTQKGQVEQNWNDLALQVQELEGRRPDDWVVAEASFFSQLAGKKLWLDNDKKTASALLGNAIQELENLQDPSLLEVIRQIKADKDVVDAIEMPDIEAISAKLNSLQQLTDMLPLSSAQIPTDINTAPEPLSDSVSDWQQNLSRSLDKFIETFFVIHSREGRVNPMLAPDQAWYVRENVKTKLLLAQMAAEKNQQQAYESSLLAAENWATRYFAVDDGSTSSMLAQLARLRQLDVKAELPDQLRSIRMLNDLVKQRAADTLAGNGGELNNG